jgi:hypothetical protein
MSHLLDPLPPEVASLLEEERTAEGLEAPARDRLRVRLARLGSIPLPVPAAAGGGDGGASGAAAAAKGALATKIGIAAIAFGIGGATGAAVHATLGPARSVPRVVVVEGSARATPVAPPPVDTPGAAVVESAPSRASASPRAASDAPTREDRLRRERASLEVARTALTRGDFAGALAAIDRHARDFPRGQLAEERESMRVQALVGLGRTSEARDQASRFRRDFPGSMLQGAVDTALGTRDE